VSAGALDVSPDAQVRVDPRNGNETHSAAAAVILFRKGGNFSFLFFFGKKSKNAESAALHTHSFFTQQLRGAHDNHRRAPFPWKNAYVSRCRRA
jgi:hypothetical protein